MKIFRFELDGYNGNEPHITIIAKDEKTAKTLAESELNKEWIEVNELGRYPKLKIKSLVDEFEIKEGVVISFNDGSY